MIARSIVAQELPLRWHLGGFMLRDLRYAVRMLRKNRGFAAVAICSLAIGIGATSSIYSIADALLLRPLPVPNSGGVVAVTAVTDQMLAGLNTLSYPDYVDFRDRNRTFADLIVQTYSSFGFAPDAASLPRMKFGMFVSGNFFRVLGVEPAIGRGFRPDEDRAVGRDAVVVLSHDLWVSEYGARLSAIGERLWLNGIGFTIIGVAAESFAGTDQFIRPALYVPFAMSPRLTGVNNLDQRQFRWLTMKGRLKPGVSIAQAQADIGGITNVLQKTYPQIDGNLRVKVESQLQFQTEFSPPRTAFVVMLLLLSVCVLLVACANVAGLLLSRAGARAREIAVRLAIGAGRGPLIRLLLIENLLLAIGGGIAGLGVAYTAVRLWNSLPMPTDLPIDLGVHLDRRVLMFTAGVSILSTFLFGLAPALRTTKPDLVPALKATDGVSSSSRKRGRLWGRNLLVGGQVALSLVLLIVSAVVVEGFRADLDRGPGFRIDRLFLTSLNTSLVRYTDSETQQFYKRLLDKTRVAPDVESAALASSVPLAIGGALVGVVPEGYQLKRGQEAISVFDNIVSDGYFETMRIPINRGRTFLESDLANTPAVAVVNEQFAEHFWPGRSPLGKRFRLRNAGGKSVEVVGVAKMTKYLSVSEAPLDFVYLPFTQNQQSQMTLIAKSKSPDPTVLKPVVRRVIQEIDRNMPVFDTRSMKDIYENRVVKTSNVINEIVAALGVMGLILAVIGLYGLIAYSVSRRTREIGIRMAIGADRPIVLGMVLRQGLTLGLAGIAVGLPIGILACRAINSIQFLRLGRVGVLPFLAVSVLLLLTTAGATYLPAQRASRVDPMRALREE
jgi:macrolide transport system ATP-binding/permease protein